MPVSSAIILAGGLGTRLRSAVPDVPKPMAPVAGRPFLEYQLDYWLRQGVQRFVLSVGYKHEVIERHFGSAYKGASIRYAREERPLGTGGGLLLAADTICGCAPWLVLNGDTFFDVSLPALQSFHETHQADMTLSLFKLARNARYTSVAVDMEQRITQLDASDAKEDILINGGVYLVGRNLFEGLAYRAGEPVSLESDILRQALARGKRLFGYATGGRFIDIGVPEDYARAAEVFAAPE